MPAYPNNPIQIYCVPALNDNYIWLLGCNGRAAVIDPGEAAPVRAALEREGLLLTAILVTHHHVDHQGGIAQLLQSCPEMPVYGPALESITGLSVALAGDEVLDFCGHAITVMPVPGHTLGHLAYRVGSAVFCGDVLFGAGCGRLFEGTAGQMAQSLALIAALPDETQIYCAHEYTEANLRFALAIEPENAAIRARCEQVRQLRSAGLPSVPLSLREEKASNPFLRLNQPDVLVAAQNREPGAGLGDTPATEDVFAVLRRWRNVF